MKRLTCRLAPGAALGVVLFGACAPNNSVPPGPPVLTEFQVIDPASGPVDLSVAGATVPPRSYLFALFDRLLDGAAVTMLDPDGGADLGRTDLATSTIVTTGTTPTLTEVYTPNGGPVGLFFMQGPSIIVRAGPTFPSAATVTVTLDKIKIHSKAGQPWVAGPMDSALPAGELMFETAPFSATINTPAADPDGGTNDAGMGLVMPQMQMVQIQFSNLTDPNIASHITVTAGGLPFTGVTIVPDDSDPALFDVTPVTAWPPSTNVVVTVDADAADVMGIKLGAGATSGSFPTEGS